jgi:hypothetical protein
MLTHRDIGRDHIKAPVVIADGGREDASGTACFFQGKLAGAGEAVTNLLPVNQIAAVEDRHAREILERTGDEVIILFDAADARIRVKTGNDGVSIFHLGITHLLNR